MKLILAIRKRYDLLSEEWNIWWLCWLSFYNGWFLKKWSFQFKIKMIQSQEVIEGSNLIIFQDLQSEFHTYRVVASSNCQYGCSFSFWQNWSYFIVIPARVRHKLEFEPQSRQCLAWKKNCTAVNLPLPSSTVSGSPNICCFHSGCGQGGERLDTEGQSNLYMQIVITSCIPRSAVFISC